MKAKKVAEVFGEWKPGFVDPVYGVLGERVRVIRTALGITQAELAERVGVKRTSIVNFEAGRQQCPLHVMLQMAYAMSVKPSNLFQGILN